MDLIGEVLMETPRERVWDALNDVTVLQSCIPGCEELVDESPSVRRARVMVKMGPVRARFNGRVTLSEIEPPARCVMSFEGSGGAAGMASGRSQVELHEHPDGTRLTYTVKASVGGKLGQIGGRMMDASAKQLADRFFEALRATLAPPAKAPVLTPAGSAPVPSSAALPADAQTMAAAAPAAAAAPLAYAPAAARAVPPAATEFSRVLWFFLGVGATAFGVWLGAILY